jgi:hypothetical protein
LLGLGAADLSCPTFTPAAYWLSNTPRRLGVLVPCGLGLLSRCQNAPVRYRLAVTLADARIIQLRRVQNPKGNLTPIEAGVDVPFEIRRVYYLYDVPGGEERGGHAHRALHQFIVAASGSFEVVLDDGAERKSFFLNRSWYGLYVPPMMWRELTNFSSGSVSLVLASAHYDEADYIRDYDAFLRERR